MVREDILSGIKQAISKGETLQKAMQSFYNAGYKKKDIEDVAREILLIKEREKQVIKKNIKDSPMKLKEKKVIQKKINPLKKGEIQKISKYESPLKKKDNKLVVIILAIILTVLFGFLLTIIFLKDKLF